jgi:hypothetical protein
MGDVNRDGIVDCADFNLVQASFGKSQGQSGYNPAADLNGDGVVNIQDLSTVARNVPKGTVCKTFTWPANQLTPSFPAPAQTQDLVTFPGFTETLQAITNFSHATGENDGDGWGAQPGIDTPNAYMLYGPGDTTVPVGQNTATFSAEIDDNAVDNNPQIILDVFDDTTGQVLASQTITRQQFTTASSYVTFDVPFTLATAGDALEYRVYWLGDASIEVNTVTIAIDQHEIKTLFSSLKGIVNLSEPRIFSYEGNDQGEGANTWLDSLGYSYNSVTDIWSLVTKYRNEVQGIIVYDPDTIDTLNLATVLAGSRHALVAAPSQVARLTAPPYNLPILIDLRGQYTTNLQVYQAMFNDYWPSLQHRILFELNPKTISAKVREYATAVGGACVWLNPKVPAEGALLNQFLASMGPGKIVMGWWANEAAGVTDASEYGIATVASDDSNNLTFYGGTPRTITPKPTPPPPAIQNKIYVAFVYSDGDNLQYDEHLLRKLWGGGARGKVPLGWTVSPAMVDAMPGALNYYWSTATNNDELLSGPSGYGYAYPNDWPDANDLNQFISTSADYASRAGLRIITVWNTITGGINQNVGDAYAAYAPSLLGITAQNTGGGTTIYGNTLPAEAFDCNYCASPAAMQQAVTKYAKGWDGKEPRFILIQAQPWTNVVPKDFVTLAASLDSDYVVVRPDNFFQLLREANNLPMDPPQ